MVEHEPPIAISGGHRALQEGAQGADLRSTGVVRGTVAACPCTPTADFIHLRAATVSRTLLHRWRGTVRDAKWSQFGFVKVTRCAPRGDW